MLEEPVHEWEPFMLEVTDLRQYRSCKRIVFYRYCLPYIRPITGKMEVGIERHDEEKDREERRSLHAYGLESGERHFNLLLQSTVLGLVGQLDLLIISAGEAIPVEYKLTQREIGPHIRLQLTAYALLIEDQWQLPVQRGFIYRLGQRRAEAITITSQQRKQVKQMIADIHAMIEYERMPEPPAKQNLCVDCEFRRFCNDVL